MRFGLRFSLFLAVAATILPLAAQTQRQPIGRLVNADNAIEWQSARHAPVVLSVQRPDGEVVTETFAAGQSPTLRLATLADGVYSYELRSAAEVQAGTFSVANGALAPDVLENAISGRPPMRPATETFFTGDVSAQGGVCGGFDCTNAEAYGFATIKLKENNVRLKFEDTSVSAGFSTTDWQLSAGDTTATSVEKFFVEDLTAGTVPLLIEGGTPNHALYLDSTGRIGLRTSTPAKDLDISAPISPTIRMNQSASPFQAWDIVANHNNFYVRDVNNESNPFIIRTGVPNNTVVLDSTGRIGLGVSLPSYAIHHSSGARLDAGVWVDASSRAVKQDIQSLDRDAAFDALRSLAPVTFAYKANPADMHVGFIAEDVPDLVATPDRKGLAPMDVVAVLTKVIQEQQKTIEEMKMRLERVEQKQ